MTDIERALHEAQLRFQRSQLRPEPTSLPCSEVRGVSYREPQSRTWQSQHQDYRPAGYWTVFCAHDKLYVDVCQQCKRDRREASCNAREWSKRVKQHTQSTQR